jgi:hypothetical protein
MEGGKEEEEHQSDGRDDEKRQQLLLLVLGRRQLQHVEFVKNVPNHWGSHLIDNNDDSNSFIYIVINYTARPIYMGF